ncbi:MAG: DNA-directed RNA polymerase subunit alpha [Planctomycetes bacterium]|nr:DNA-directed RNA polymerase subunit alpha [Planctomycetota bacterium]MCP4837802.1 DNA-directed RNA polymerase subunit alpha [Planctomycetota bacterium]
MHVRWRGLELPARVDVDAESRSDSFARFTVEPLERGFGTTIGNSLRRILLSSIEGAAITTVTVGGVEHEFTTIPGMKEDVTDLLLNIKGLVVAVDSDDEGPKTMSLRAGGPGAVTADLVEADPAIRILNPDHLIATLTEAINLDIEMTVSRGRGYSPASERHLRSAEEQVIGQIEVDAIYSPVLRVRFRVEDTRVGQKTNFDRLVMDVWTDSTVTPEMALTEASKILRKHLNPFVQVEELGNLRVSDEAAAAAAVDDSLIHKLNTPVTELDLTVRSNNCLESAAIATVSELVIRSEAELLALRSFGKTSLREIVKKLEEMGLALGMRLPEGFTVPEGAYNG